MIDPLLLKLLLLVRSRDDGMFASSLSCLGMREEESAEVLLLPLVLLIFFPNENPSSSLRDALASYEHLYLVLLLACYAFNSFLTGTSSDLVFLLPRTFFVDFLVLK